MSMRPAPSLRPPHPRPLPLRGRGNCSPHPRLRRGPAREGASPRSAMFDSVLIANRGEIAVRIARTARRLGLRTIAIASDADRDSVHARACDELVVIGGERPADSYLRIDKVLDAARRSGARAMHPGYGFLAENAAFAQAVVDAGLVWIGPPSAAMAAMGDKARARQRAADARRAGRARLRRRRAGRRMARERSGAHRLSAAGEGEQRRWWPRHAARRLRAPICKTHCMPRGAKRKRRSATRNSCSSVRCQRPRHVEIQVFGDAHGNVIHLGERDCSVQRRHQKLVEEAPCPALTPALRGAWASAR